MHTYNKNGTRAQKLQNKKEVKKHLKGFYSMLAATTEVADYLKSLNLDVEFTEENIDQYTQPLTGRKLDNMEKFLILGKLNNKDAEDNIKED